MSEKESEWESDQEKRIRNRKSESDKVEVEGKSKNHISRNTEKLRGRKRNVIRSGKITVIKLLGAEAGVNNLAKIDTAVYLCETQYNNVYEMTSKAHV